MTSAFALKILLEVAVVLLLAYGFYKEDELIELETVLKQYIRKQFKKLHNCK